MFLWGNGFCVLNLNLQINLIVEQGIHILGTAFIEWYYYFYYLYS